MTDETEALTITDPHKVRVTFANQLAGSGFYGGVVNLTLATAQFTPQPDDTVAPDLVICSRLRMDMLCARQMWEALGRILEQNLQPKNGSTH